MRGIFVQTLLELAAEDERIILLTGDLGFMALEPFAQRFPHRFFNVGVAEQNMIGLATGLAEAGFIPFAYSIGTFAALRGYEFVRNGPAFHHLPVRVVGVGAGFEYSHAGLTHHSLEDVGVMRIQPTMRVIAPADVPQAAAAIRATYALPEPIYYRIGKNDKLIIPELKGHFELGQPDLIGTGSDLLFVTMGSIAREVLHVAHQLRETGIDSTIAVISTLNPPTDLAPVLSRFSQVISVEDHYIVGGVGSLVAECIAEQGLSCRLTRCGVRSLTNGRSGSQEWLRAQHGLAPDQLIETAKQIVQGAAVN